MIFCSFVVVSMKYIHLHLPYQVKRFCLKLRYVYIQQLINSRQPPQLRCFIWVYHVAAQGSNPVHTINAFFNLDYLHLYWNEKRTKINKKEAGIGQFLKKLIKTLICMTLESQFIIVEHGALLIKRSHWLA